MHKKLKILILEDSQDDVTLIEWELRKAGFAFSSLVVSTHEAFRQALCDYCPDVILSDHFLPSFNSIDAFRIYKEYEDASGVRTPFILVTGHGSEEFAFQSLRAGVHDYILKDRLKRLPMAIESAVEKCAIENERQQFLNQLIAKEALMSEAEKMAGFGSWELDIRTGKLIWSDAIYLMYGYAPGQIDPDYPTFRNHVHPDDRGFLAYDLANPTHRREEYEFQFRIKDLQGNLKHLHCKMKVQRDKLGNPVRLVGFNLDITARKEAEVALKKREQEYRSLFDRNPDAVFSVDFDGKFMNVNSQFAAMVGLDRAELLGKDFRTVLIGSRLEEVFGDFICNRSRTSRRYETDFVNRAGKMFVLDVTLMAIVVDNRVMGVHCIGKDITERRDLEKLLNQAYRSAKIGLWEYDVQKEKVTWSDITRELFGVSKEYQPTVEAAISFFFEGDQPVISEVFRRCVQDGTPWDLELQIVTAQGNKRWVKSIGEAKMKGGKSARVYGTLQDVHDRKMAQEASLIAYRDQVKE